MKKRIHGLLYNTDTAKKITDWYSTYPVSDSHYVHEALYKKRTGEYFLYGEGGAASKYKKEVEPHMWTDGEDIIPLSIPDTKVWLEKHQDDYDSDIDLYEQEFGAIKDSTAKVDLHLQISETANDKLKRMAQQQGITQGEVLDNLIMHS